MMKKLMASIVFAILLIGGTTAAFAAEHKHHTVSHKVSSKHHEVARHESEHHTTVHKVIEHKAATPAAKPAPTVAPYPTYAPRPTPAAPAPSQAPKPTPTPAVAPSPAPVVAPVATPAASLSQADKLISFAQSLTGKVHYSFGKRVTSDPNNMLLDCSSYTQYVYKQALGIDIPWGSRDQYAKYPHVAKADLQKDDLLFFYNPIHHVGIYMGNGKFIHNTTGSVYGVTISDLNTSSYASKYTGAVRVIK